MPCPGLQGMPRMMASTCAAPNGPGWGRRSPHGWRAPPTGGPAMGVACDTVDTRPSLRPAGRQARVSGAARRHGRRGCRDPRRSHGEGGTGQHMTPSKILRASAACVLSGMAAVKTRKTRGRKAEQVASKVEAETQPAPKRQRVQEPVEVSARAAVAGALQGRSEPPGLPPQEAQRFRAATPLVRPGAPRPISLADPQYQFAEKHSPPVRADDKVGPSTTAAPGLPMPVQTRIVACEVGWALPGGGYALLCASRRSKRAPDVPAQWRGPHTAPWCASLTAQPRPRAPCRRATTSTSWGRT